MIEQIEYRLVLLLLWAARLLPANVLYGFFALLSRLMFVILRKRRRQSIANIKRAFGYKSDAQCKSLALESYLGLSETIVEILLMIVGRFDIDSAIINKDEAIAKIQSLSSKEQCGVMELTAHYANWELLAHFMALHGLKMLAVGRKGNNRLIEERITTPYRRLHGNDTVFKKGAALALMKHLKRCGNVGLLIDQKVSPKDGFWVDFFGYKAPTTSLVAALKKKLNIKVVPIFIRRVKKGKYEILFKEPLELKDELEGEQQLIEFTQQMNNTLESVIRQEKSQWFWMHNRWRM